MTTEQFTTRQKLLAEGFGSATLVFVIVSAGLLADGMLQATPSIGVLFIGLATAGWLFVIVQILAPISGAHVNPAVTIALVVTGDVDAETARQYIPAQFLGGVLGVGLAGLTFVSTIGWEVFAISAVERPASTWLAEFVGTIVLVSAVISLLRQESDWIGLAVGFTVGMGIIATSSTAFLNPQVAFARIFTSGIAGIQPFDAVMFMFASTLGGVAAGLLWRYLWPRPTPIDRLKPKPGDDSLLEEPTVES
ncbi:aquaporin [Natronorubrum thiooxidans]|uniref:Glycerol uptake facilitator (Major Intrinsic Protein Family) n=1 Tax=Natronorubrum thiooxidans TaxID=308853 RepID=A0A1N7FVY2_9EURY|nr:aquaporin [Natronorubrum thiooxidans]SIS04518.1 Glycerol uptake facilitator (Major Intrinsic Protein Family) [Natronorubrum thiooxidans]